MLCNFVTLFYLTEYKLLAPMCVHGDSLLQSIAIHCLLAAMQPQRDLEQNNTNILKLSGATSLGETTAVGAVGGGGTQLLWVQLSPCHNCIKTNWFILVGCTRD